MDMNQTFTKYTNSIQNSTQQSNFNFSLLFSVIIFVAVAAFVFVYVRNFIKGYKLQDITNLDKKSQNENMQISMKQNINNSVIYCNTCGQENDIDSRFCKNCGTRLK